MALSLALPWIVASAAPEFPAVVVEAGSGRILEARAVDRPWFPASLTKLMTLYLTFEALAEGRLALTTRLETSPHAAAQPPVKLGLRPGQRIDVETAVRAIVSVSSNDVAVVLAEALAGAEAAFAVQMTLRARSIGMLHTQFHNATGLPNSGQLTTARDMAILATRLLQDFPQYHHYFSGRSFRFGNRTYHTQNGLLGSYRGLDGMKTGYTCGSGYNMVASAVRGERRLVAVVLGADSIADRNRRARKLLDAGFASAPRGASRRRLDERPRARPGAAPPARVSGTSCSVPAEPLPWPTATWGILLGVHGAREAADLAVMQARRHLRDVVPGGHPVLLPKARPRQQAWKTLLVGFSEREAIRACRRLWATGVQCLVQSPRVLNEPDYARR